MSIENQINRIKSSKNSIITEINKKGVSVPQNAKIETLAAAVSSIPVIRSVNNKNPDSKGNVTITSNDVGAEPKENIKTFKCTFSSSGWSKIGDDYVQTVSCTGMKKEYNCEPPWCFKTGNKSFDLEVEKSLSELNHGVLQTLDGKVKATVYNQIKSNITIYTRRVV